MIQKTISVLTWMFVVTGCCLFGAAGCGEPDDRDILAGPLENGVLLYRDDAGDLVVAHDRHDLLVQPGDVGTMARQCWSPRS